MKNIELKDAKAFKVSKAVADFVLKHGFMPMSGGAIINDYVNTLTKAGKLDMGTFTNGGGAIVLIQTFEVAAADDDGSIYRLFKNIAPDLIPIRASVYNDALTAGTVWDLGLYDTLAEGGAVISDAVFATAMDFSTAHVPGNGLNGLGNVDQAAIVNRIYQHAGHTLITAHRGYDIALTADTVGSAAGTVSVVMEFAQG